MIIEGSGPLLDLAGIGDLGFQHDITDPEAHHPADRVTVGCLGLPDHAVDALVQGQGRLEEPHAAIVYFEGFVNEFGAVVV